MSQIPLSPAVEFPPPEYSLEPEVSIVILNYNKPEMTRACLAHVWAHTSGYRYEVIVVDNGSSAENLRQLRQIVGPFRLLPLQINRFFGEGNNIGAEAANGSYVVFLNNDAFVTQGWLTPLIDKLRDEPLLGGVGPRFLYPDGRIQEAGSFIGFDGVVEQVGKFGAYSHADIAEDHVVDYVSAACFAMKRDLFIEVGGFEFAYEPAYYEDADLCLKLARRGLFIGYCAGSEILHVENATSSDHREQLGLQNIIEVNRSQFLRAWGKQLTAREDSAIAAWSPPRASNYSKRPRAVFYTPFDITPGGGERYLLTAAIALLPDFDVSLATEETYSRTRTLAIGRALSLDLHGLDLIERRNLSSLDPIELSVIMSNEALPPFSGFAPRNLYLCQFPFPQHWAEDIRRGGNIDSFAATVVYSSFVRDCLVAKRESLCMGSSPIKVVAPPVPLASSALVPAELAPPYRIVLVGRFFAGGHNKRHDVAIEAVRQLVAAGVPVVLDLIDNLLPNPAHRDYYMRMRALAEGLPVTFHPNATPETLATLLARGHIYIHATGYDVDPAINPHECEHFGISVLEAMSHGLAPFVVGNGGPAGFITDGHNGYTYLDVAELVSKIVAALEAPEKLGTLRRAAVDRATQFSEASFISAWRELVAETLD